VTVRQRLWVIVGATLAAPVASVLAAAPQTVLAQPPGSCPPGQTGVIYGCTPFCLPGKALDLQTGLCMPVPPPPPPAPMSRY
jgi:hypothetical protein